MFFHPRPPQIVQCKPAQKRSGGAEGGSGRLRNAARIPGPAPSLTRGGTCRGSGALRAGAGRRPLRGYFIAKNEINELTSPRDLGKGFPCRFGRRLPEGVPVEKQVGSKESKGRTILSIPCPSAGLLFHFCMRGPEPAQKPQSMLSRTPRAKSSYRHHFAIAKTWGKCQGGTAGEETLRGYSAPKEGGCPPFEPFLPGLPAHGSTLTLQPPPTHTDSTSKLS